MNIVHICKRFSPAIGGVESHVFAVAHQQVLRKKSVTVLTQATDATQEITEVINGITVLRLSHKTGEDKKAVWQEIQLYSSVLKEADVVQVHDVFWWILPQYFLIVGKCYTTFHGWETQFPIPFTAKLQRWVYAKLSTKTVHIGGWIQKYYWDKPSVVMYGGVTIPQAVPKHSTKLKNGIFLGRLSVDNDVEKYVFLTRILKEEFPGFAMTWVGDGELKAVCAEVGKVTGFVADPKDFIAKADVVFAASYLSILQAQVYGKPVVALYSNKLKEEYLNDLPTRLSMVCREAPVDAYAELAILFEDEMRVKKVSETAARLASYYSWSTVSDTYQSLWQK